MDQKLPQSTQSVDTSLKEGGRLPLWGRRCPVGTVLRRSPLPLRSVLDAPHWGAGPEPAGETVSCASMTEGVLHPNRKKPSV